ncbi:unnamed protein product [Moneuplotes crassus]|uniref:Uncharacterized protein n=1 Tax=Euplotes crassus TaxID=5936 RepID=A0AAD1XQ91_EUPCR|nr:unnamed protein product [Moneuplotes crassus]
MTDSESDGVSEHVQDDYYKAYLETMEPYTQEYSNAVDKLSYFEKKKARAENVNLGIEELRSSDGLLPNEVTFSSSSGSLISDKPAEIPQIGEEQNKEAKKFKKCKILKDSMPSQEISQGLSKYVQVKEKKCKHKNKILELDSQHLREISKKLNMNAIREKLAKKKNLSTSRGNKSSVILRNYKVTSLKSYPNPTNCLTDYQSTWKYDECIKSTKHKANMRKSYGLHKASKIKYKIIKQNPSQGNQTLNVIQCSKSSLKPDLETNPSVFTPKRNGGINNSIEPSGIWENSKNEQLEKMTQSSEHTNISMNSTLLSKPMISPKLAQKVFKSDGPVSSYMKIHKNPPHTLKRAIRTMDKNKINLTTNNIPKSTRRLSLTSKSALSTTSVKICRKTEHHRKPDSKPKI